jgi:hypothetical protein
MVSKVRAPDALCAVSRVGLRLFLTAAWVGVALAASGCPVREQQILITTSGVQSLTGSCNRPCVNSVETEDGGVMSVPRVCSASCGLPGHLPPEFSQATQARLFIVTPASKRIRDSSKCMTLPPCRAAGRAGCLADAMNQQLDGAIANGLGFNGLENPDDVVLFMAFYQQQDFQPQDPAASQPSCRRVDLVACAGLAPPLGGGDYDISCASCQDGAKNPQSRNNGPCPKDNGSCFLDTCDGWLSSNGFE